MKARADDPTTTLNLAAGEKAATGAAADHVDVLIVGAGISGIGAAYHLQDKQPGLTYAILEARGAIGGTWDLFRYPGIRSDSDLHTFGYAFKPWTDEQAIADGASIRGYIKETAAENRIEEQIRFGHHVTRASFSSASAAWTVTGTRGSEDEPFALTATWLFCAGGYFRYDEGFTPPLEGIGSYGGTLIHPQHWPEDLDIRGKRVVVIGSGATAVTLVPAMAEQGAHVTMLQRSPSYILPVPSRDVIANRLRGVLGERRAYALTRRKNIALQTLVYKLARRFPDRVRAVIRRVNLKHLPAGVDVDTHFKPRYDPWDQRLCAVPDGDLFRSLHTGRAAIVTDEIATFTERGLRLRSGRELEADIVVTATGLNLQAFGGIALYVDEAPVRLPETVAYKGSMLSGVPNFFYAIGYVNASWTLKVDLVCEYFCRLLAHCAATGADGVVPQPPDPAMPRRPLLDFSAGYVLRSLERFPRQGPAEPWKMSMSYAEDVRRLRRAPVADGVLRFFSRAAPGPEEATAAVRGDELTVAA